MKANKRWLVLATSLLINVLVGSIYAWSLFQAHLLSGSVLEKR